MTRDATTELCLRYDESITTDDMVALYASKQRDYGHDNILKFGKDGVLVRLWDKVARWNNLIARGGEAANEPLEDTLKDIIGYCVILQMLENDTFTLPLAEDVQVLTVNQLEANLNIFAEDDWELEVIVDDEPRKVTSVESADGKVTFRLD